ncbi:MAG: PhzF family phenazine biosynthesis protein [Acidimicrobiia bacterium]|nr:PhzF family phenazine biosynthesis protein [Acidimicrobiia bacterium]MDH3463626.1 PhzF family phenazine biosynthesis protein [Acidimicrobiia bacterium]
MMDVTARVLRVFTRDGVGGNHLGFVDVLDGLDTNSMHATAAALGYAETVFVDSNETPPYVRIFTPGQELPFAGHPLVGTAWMWLTQDGVETDRLRCGIGEVRIGLTDDTATWIEAEIDPANARSIDLADYAIRGGLPEPSRSWRVVLPKEYAILEYSDVSDVATASPDAEVMKERFGTMVVARTPGGARVRFFAPDAGVFEDAATGSAAVALATALVHDGETDGELVIHQGEEMGHPSRIELSWTPTTAIIGGSCALEAPRTVSIGQ